MFYLLAHNICVCGMRVAGQVAETFVSGHVQRTFSGVLAQYVNSWTGDVFSVTNNACFYLSRSL